MAKRTYDAKPDRYLKPRNGLYYYVRRVPAIVAALDERAPTVRRALGTDDLAKAMAMRDVLARADDVLWGALLPGDADEVAARERYERAVRYAAALGFQYRTSHEVAALPFEEFARRMQAVGGPGVPQAAVEAVLGKWQHPPKEDDGAAVTFREAFDLYKSEIMRQDLARKSPSQLRRWEGKHLWAIAEFEKVVGRKPLAAITREDALAFYNHWQDKVVPRKGERTQKRDGKRYSASAGNRSIGILRAMHTRYFAHLFPEQHRANPFAGLSFKEPKKGKKTRPPFPTEWIVEKFLQPGPLARMNEEERDIFLALIETGARLGELCDLTPDRIFLDGPIPYIRLEPSEDLDDPHEQKTESSLRTVPLVGVSLAVFRKHPEGFPRYRDRANSVSATLNKFLRENGLFPTRKHVVYSLRHSFEDRMIHVDIPEDVRKALMGHSQDSPCYGEKGSLVWRQRKLTEMALPFDPSIV